MRGRTLVSVHTQTRDNAIPMEHERQSIALMITRQLISNTLFSGISALSDLKNAAAPQKFDFLRFIAVRGPLLTIIGMNDFR